MKYLLLLILSFVFVTCAPENKSVFFEASLVNMKSDEIKISGFEFEKILTVDEQGIISDTLHIPQEGLYALQFGRNGMYLYLKPGQNIKLSADAAKFSETVKVEGFTADIQTYLKAKEAITTNLGGSRMFTMDEVEYEENATIITDSLQVLLANAELPATFKAAEKKNMAYELARMKLMFPLYADKQVESLPVFYADPLKGINLVDENEYLESPEYRRLVESDFTTKMYSDTTKEYEILFREYIASLPVGNIKNQLLFKDMRYIMRPNENLELNYDFFNENSTNTEHLAKMAEIYAEFEQLKQGSVSPSFDYEDYKGGTTGLSDFKGKYVYVDVWATWCGPCKAEIPALKEKEAKYHGRNIEFVSISVDALKDKEKWETMVKDKALSGTQLFADNSWNSDFVQEYKINGIPRFILIDPEGKIVTADAPRPSDKKLEKTLQELSI